MTERLRENKWVTGFCFMLFLLPSMAQAESDDSWIGQSRGHSAMYFGIVSDEAQRASIQAVLSVVGLSHPVQSMGVPGSTAYFMLRMFTGGAQAPHDIAEPRTDVDALLVAE